MRKVDCKIFNKLELKKKTLRKMIDTMYTIEIHNDLDSAPHHLTPQQFKNRPPVNYRLNMSH